jgi:enoyl-CoA hydratase/carnithine racemase
MTALVTTTMHGCVAVVEMHGGPNNFFDEDLLRELSEAVLAVDADAAARSIVLCSEGKHFCAGAQLRGMTPADIRRIYRHAFALFTGRRPIVAAVQGAAVGGGLGLALAADFRVAGPNARFSANFARLGFHQGFGLSATLPAAVGRQRAAELLYTGRSVSATASYEMGLADRLAEGDPRTEALELAQEIAESAPLSVAAIRATMRRDLVSSVFAALDNEAAAQAALLETADFKEGIDAALSRRPPKFTGT